MTDYDGSLSAVVTDRDAAVPLPGVARYLSALAERWGLVAVVSGRSVRFLESALPLGEAVVLVGVHGLERKLGGEAVVLPEAVPWLPVVAEVRAEAARSLPSGAEVDDKTVSLVLHSRRAPTSFPAALAWAEEAASRSGLVAVRGRMSVELRPPVPVDKGTVVRDLSTGLGPACFLGDDRSDLPGFAALREMKASGRATVAVGVGSAEAPAELAEAVDILLPGPEEVPELLRHLVSLTGATL